jgi:hypothetical protein
VTPKILSFTGVMAFVIAMECSFPQPAKADNDKCTVVAEISVEAVAQGSLVVCTRSAHPGVCAVAAFLQSDAAKNVTKYAVTKSCEFVVERTGKVYRVTVTGNKKEVDFAMKELEKSADVRRK